MLLIFLNDLGAEPLGHGPVVQVQVAEIEEAHRLLDQLEGVVVVLAQRIPVEALVDVHQLLHRRRELFRLLEGLLEVGHQALGVGVEDVGHQHRIVGNDGPPRFGDDVRAGDPGLVADVLHLVDDVVGVLLDGVVDAGEVARLGAVVVDPEAAADVHVFEADPELLHLGVDAGPLDEGVLDLVDLGDLAADVEVEELEVVDHPVPFPGCRWRR